MLVGARRLEAFVTWIAERKHSAMIFYGRSFWNVYLLIVNCILSVHIILMITKFLLFLASYFMYSIWIFLKLILPQILWTHDTLDFFFNHPLPSTKRPKYKITCNRYISYSYLVIALQVAFTRLQRLFLLLNPCHIQFHALFQSVHHALKIFEGLFNALFQSVHHALEIFKGFSSRGTYIIKSLEWFSRRCGVYLQNSYQCTSRLKGRADPD